ncbi:MULTISPECIES: hypothetical protein [Pseudomonas syringae group]|nr:MULTISPECIES: hypothetical protein [Pseudomonas syringae group]MDU8432922.1 hypothetical protein [Pseudomonas syringae pv. actinidifoliorum]MDU8524349.1 hypothetical protein [Pseudomonas syringae pv. actinidifoliorum]MDU8528990.1 hypothetical protein [Pseudomonas syringae pv. actinidifoliorum]POP84967.1 hypothetical protein CXB34_19600 [Pseudomonas amygdali pv. morsprunorum]
MYDPDPATLKKGAITAFFFVMGSAAFGPANFPDYWWLYGCFTVLIFIHTLYLIYRCESFTTFTLSILSSFVFSFGFAAAGLAHVVLLKDMGASGAEATAVNAGLIVAMLAIYASIYFSASKFFPFCMTGNRVSRTWVQSTGLSAGLIAGVGTLASAAFVDSVSELTSSAVAVMGTFFICVALLVYERHAIRGLRTLRSQEKSMPTPYTFMQIDEIRAARNRWWLGRLFKWLASWRESPGT